MQETVNDKIEEHAKTIKCTRHIAYMRACIYDNGKPCVCSIIIKENGMEKNKEDLNEKTSCSS